MQRVIEKIKKMLHFVRHIIILQERFSFETLPKNNILHGIVREKNFNICWLYKTQV